MSAEYCLAVALREGTVHTKDLLRFDDLDLLDLVQRIDVVVDDALGPRSCRLVVRMADGTEHRTEWMSTPDTFNWDREEARRVASALRPEMRLDTARLDALVATALAVERHGARELVDRCVA